MGVGPSGDLPTKAVDLRSLLRSAKESLRDLPDEHEPDQRAEVEAAALCEQPVRHGHFEGRFADARGLPECQADLSLAEPEQRLVAVQHQMRAGADAVVTHRECGDRHDREHREHKRLQEIAKEHW